MTNLTKWWEMKGTNPGDKQMEDEPKFKEDILEINLDRTKCDHELPEHLITTAVLDTALIG